MSKVVITDNITGTETVVDVPDTVVSDFSEVTPEPTLEERTAALEAAMLDLILGGAV